MLVNCQLWAAIGQGLVNGEMKRCDFTGRKFVMSGGKFCGETFKMLGKGSAAGLLLCQVQRKGLE